MQQTLQQTYRHLVQQLIIRQVMSSQNTRSGRGDGGWETGGIFALFSAAAVCGVLAQAYLG